MSNADIYGVLRNLMMQLRNKKYLYQLIICFSILYIHSKKEKEKKDEKRKWVLIEVTVSRLYIMFKGLVHAINENKFIFSSSCFSYPQDISYP